MEMTPMIETMSGVENPEDSNPVVELDGLDERLVDHSVDREAPPWSWCG
jgi:hypothetical protein